MIKVYDNGGETFDRYTIVLMDCPEHGGLFACYCMSENPRSGVGGHASCQVGSHLGKLIDIDMLPRECREVLIQMEYIKR